MLTFKSWQLSIRQNDEQGAICNDQVRKSGVHQRICQQLGSRIAAIDGKISPLLIPRVLAAHPGYRALGRNG